MTDAALPISNAIARRLLLERNGLSGVDGKDPASTSRDKLPGLVNRLGYVQVDSVNTVARAHHMILRSRWQGYRPGLLIRHLEKKRTFFEHWTHDASIIPTEFFPHWHLRFTRDSKRLVERWKRWQQHEFVDKFDEVLKQISDHGPVSSSDVGEGEERRSSGWWNWHPSKTALEYLWRSGAISVCRREGFQKIYDLTERVIPAETLALKPSIEESINWACDTSLERLGVASAKEIASFWGLVHRSDVTSWCERELAAGRLIDVEIIAANGKKLRKGYARPEIAERLGSLPSPSSALRILSPFDPLLRDRSRMEQVFGFRYRIEIFVPEAQRQYGYYVFPVLEGDRFVGRIDMRTRKTTDALEVTAYWPETGFALGKGRLAKLSGELERLAAFSGVSSVTFLDGWMRAAK